MSPASRLTSSDAGLPWSTTTGGPVSPDCRLDLIEGHDLRGTAVTLLAEAGCTTPQLAAISGHSFRTVTKVLDKYLARTRVLAGEAVSLFESAKATKFASRLQTRTATSPTAAMCCGRAGFLMMSPLVRPKIYAAWFG
jgi:hypothetical protein